MENASFVVENSKTFENLNGDTLELYEIINSKKITLVKISYLTKEKKIRAKGIKGFFGSKVLNQEEEEVIISDTSGISLQFQKDTGVIKIRFSKKEEFEKINDLDYDKSTLRTSCVMNKVKPYMVMSHVQNLKQIFWEDK